MTKELFVYRMKLLDLKYNRYLQSVANTNELVEHWQYYEDMEETLNAELDSLWKGLSDEDRKENDRLGSPPLIVDVEGKDGDVNKPVRMTIT
jgi:hypothetical protein